jgi:prepilin-type N-terminal cleavage/methylation domain-containing protein
VKINKTSAFTLVEILVSLTIFSIIVTSIIWIYITSSDIIVKSDINRKMQENLKNVSSEIAEDIRKN